MVAHRLGGLLTYLHLKFRNAIQFTAASRIGNQASHSFSKADLTRPHLAKQSLRSLLEKSRPQGVTALLFSLLPDPWSSFAYNSWITTIGTLTTGTRCRIPSSPVLPLAENGNAIAMVFCLQLRWIGMFDIIRQFANLARCSGLQVISTNET